jgi:hypothetical protein
MSAGGIAEASAARKDIGKAYRANDKYYHHSERYAGSTSRRTPHLSAIVIPAHPLFCYL